MAPRTTGSRAGPNRLRWAPELVQMSVPAPMELALDNEVQVAAGRMPTRLCLTSREEASQPPIEADLQTEERVLPLRHTTHKAWAWAQQRTLSRVELAVHPPPSAILRNEPPSKRASSNTRTRSWSSLEHPRCSYRS